MLASCAVLLAAVAGCAPASFLITPVPAKQQLVEQVVQRDSFWAYQKIALIDVDGVIANVRSSSLLGSSGENPVALFAEKLEQAAQDDDVEAVVVRINSPGGAVTASDIMYTELQRFREKTGKPVVAAMLDVAASGGYYLACAADKIYAQPTTVTGSIGVIMLAPEFSGTMLKLGVQMNVIKSGDMKDMGSMFRAMNAEDRAVFQGLIDKMYARFLEVVARSRGGMDAERLREFGGRPRLPRPRGPGTRAGGRDRDVARRDPGCEGRRRAGWTADQGRRVQPAVRASPERLRAGRSARGPSEPGETLRCRTG